MLRFSRCVSERETHCERPPEFYRHSIKVKGQTRIRYNKTSLDLRERSFGLNCRNGIESSLIQRKAERRGHETGVIPWIEKGPRSCLYAYMYAFMYICSYVFLEYITVKSKQGVEISTKQKASHTTRCLDVVSSWCSA